ncbi:MAG TPA: CDP-diacylglycerol--serine O-phosphatidyltransferase [Pseudomonadales bacterium]|nr:CDP-diacylglycerol--serine O-phosphatidyltransferase [Pseudomonadales bacterium]
MTDKEAQDNPSNDSDLSGIENILPVDEHEEEISINGKTERRRGIYLLPNLFTTAALFSGFYAIVSGVNGNFEAASIAIFVSMIFDGLDGRVARLTNTQSKFGEQYDSLADMVSFGAAPALVMFSWALSDLGKFGWACSFIYMACAALRLARFNAMIDTADKNFFTGLASPAAASVVAGLVWVGHEQGWSGELLPTALSYLVGTITAFVGLLMIANLRYNSFKGIDLRGRVPFVALLIVVLIFALVTVDPARVLLATAIIYAFSGPVQFVLGKVKATKKV